MYLAIGFIASFGYYMGLRRSNSRKERGLCNETILSDREDATPELVQQAAEQRAKIEASQTGVFGRLTALRMRYGEAAGGVYATVNEAKEQKGDAYSGYGESLCFAGRGMSWSCRLTQSLFHCFFSIATKSILTSSVSSVCCLHYIKYVYH
jgi:hypothetical protein